MAGIEHDLDISLVGAFPCHYWTHHATDYIKETTKTQERSLMRVYSKNLMEGK